MSDPMDKMARILDIKNDIHEIDDIITAYDNGYGFIETIDVLARDKISKMQKKDGIIYIHTAPKSGNPGIPWSEVHTTALYNILLDIKCYLEKKLTLEIAGQQGGDNDA